MGALVRTEQPLVFTELGLHADVEITLALDPSGGEMALIHIGHEAHTTLTFADVVSLERLAAVAADGARRLQDRTEANMWPAAASGEADRLVGAGVSR